MVVENNPLVSVYVTNFNYGRYIKDCILSVINQIYNNIELIVIDDGSLDDSVDIINDIRRDFNFEFIQQENLGLNKTNNKALSISKGKYIMRLDADDFLKKEAIGIMVSIMEANKNLNMVFPDYYLIDYKGEIFLEERRNNFRTDVQLKDLPAHGACTLIRKEKLVEVGGYNDSVNCQDGYDLWLKLGVQGSVQNIPIPLFYYRQHGENLSSSSDRILRCRKKIKIDYFFSNYNFDDYNHTIIFPVRQGYLRDKESFNILLSNIKSKIDVLNKTEFNFNFIVTSSIDLSNYFSKLANVLFVKRDAELEWVTSKLEDTIQFLELNTKNVLKNSCVIIGPEFINLCYSDIIDAIITQIIFSSTSVISVEKINTKIYYHKGQGLEVLLYNSKIKREEDVLYSGVGAITVFYLNNIKEFGSIMGDKVGHVILPSDSVKCLK